MPYKTKLDAWLTGIIEAGWLAALVLAPMFFNVFSSRVFEPDKISLVRSIALIMIVAWLIKIANGGYAWLPAANLAQGDEPSGGNWRGFIRTPFVWPVVLVIITCAAST